jgi:hypothetical protein
MHHDTSSACMSAVLATVTRSPVTVSAVGSAAAFADGRRAKAAVRRAEVRLTRALLSRSSRVLHSPVVRPMQLCGGCLPSIVAGTAHASRE